MIKVEDREHVKTLLLDISEAHGEYPLERAVKLLPDEIVLLILCAACSLITIEPTSNMIGLTDRGEEWLYTYRELCRYQ